MEYMFVLVLKTSAYATVVGLIILFIRGILKKRLSAKWQFVIWIVLILKLVVPFGPGSFISLFNIVPEIPEKQLTQVQYNIKHATNAPIVPQNIESGITSSSQQPVSNDTLNFMEDYGPYIWAFGSVSMLFWLMLTYFLFFRRLKSEAAPADERLNDILNSCKRKMGINEDIALVLQNGVASPSLFGIIRPRILLPSDASKLSDRDIEYILLHELAHHRRRDVAVNYLLLVLQTVHWFNPLMWYFFRCIRQDMELATDQKVLSVLENHEHKAYGRALLAVLEGFTPSRLAPRLLGMVDDKNNITRRIKNIALFKKPKFVWSIFAAVVVITLGAVCLTSAAGKKAAPPQAQSQADKLYKYKSQYIGDASNVGNLTSELPLGEYKKGISLKTSSKPYGLTVNYTLPQDMLSEANYFTLNGTLQSNAAVIFVLIDNVDEVSFNVNDGKGMYSYYRSMLGDVVFSGDKKNYSKDIDGFKAFLESLELRLLVFPEKYTPAMSSTPGIRIAPEYHGSAQKVRYTADKGVLLTWDASTGKITEGGKTAELPYGIPAYWTPMALEQKPVEGDSVVTVELLDENGRTLVEKNLVIVFDGSFYTVLPSPGIVIGVKSPAGLQEPASLDEAVSLAVKSRRTAYGAGEMAAEGHIILGTDEKDGEAKVYTIASFGAFGFENGIFTKVSGSGAIPTVMRFSKSEYGRYSLIEYKEPLDGAELTNSTKKLFPSKLWDEVLSTGKHYPVLLKQQEDQARAYLKSIGRDAEVNDNIERMPVKINVEASNRLFSELTKWNSELNKFPYWLGTREEIEDGTRYIYETSQNKTSDGFDLVVFKKSKEDGTIVKEYKYKIVDSEPQLID